mmetsp:Transcript_12896/g.17633  ORF Transcript_12896/g.17633 Transcript_12896/m.17633 type:complete len:207 (+) Transcript_12896:240-860(+)|eukprot:CAMPEP_0196579200 /NCGR_PEP_ID=MMETSP1081-20130531/18664_1 /TAXON_ID=36882 /ORGANISM="Pyramimonas amylifera, Strain CCMP720" /LENGTH=206 /DNA_ID=CAMNT_0041898697 /DNA_START=236 /DNA_END=856 /DNA_ORIENTATION=-
MDGSCSTNFEALHSLLQAPSKSFVTTLFNDAFTCKNEGWTTDRRLRIQMDLGLRKEEDVSEVFSTIVWLIRRTVYDSKTAEEISKEFPPDFHPDLRVMLTKILISRQIAWREEAIKSQVSLPRLVEFNWRVDNTETSDSVHVGESQIEPSTFIHFTMEGEPKSTQEVPPLQEVTIELDKAALSTMVSTLNKIQDALNSTAGNAEDV